MKKNIRKNLSLKKITNYMYDLLMKKELRGDEGILEKVLKMKKTACDLVRKKIELNVKKLLKLIKQFDMKRADTMLVQAELQFLKIWFQTIISVFPNLF